MIAELLWFVGGVTLGANLGLVLSRALTASKARDDAEEAAAAARTQAEMDIIMSGRTLDIDPEDVSKMSPAFRASYETLLERKAARAETVCHASEAVREYDLDEKPTEEEEAEGLCTLRLRVARDGKVAYGDPVVIHDPSKDYPRSAPETFNFEFDDRRGPLITDYPIQPCDIGRIWGRNDM